MQLISLLFTNQWSFLSIPTICGSTYSNKVTICIIGLKALNSKALIVSQIEYANEI